MQTLEEIDKRTLKFNGFSQGSQNALDINAFADIYEDVQEKIYDYSFKEAHSFFTHYFDMDIAQIDEQTLEQHLDEFTTLYTQRSVTILQELEEIDTLKKELSYHIDELVFQSFEWQTSFFAIFYNRKIAKHAQKVQVLSLKMDTLNQSYQRRIRWSMDLVIGDYYVIYMMYSYLFVFSETHENHNFTPILKKYLTKLLDTVASSLKSYSLNDAKIIHRYIILELSLLKDS